MIIQYSATQSRRGFSRFDSAILSSLRQFHESQARNLAVQSQHERAKFCSFAVLTLLRE
jgi:hypothetical protein